MISKTPLTPEEESEWNWLERRQGGDRRKGEAETESALEKAERIAVAALNESHQRHGIDDVVACKFCTSRAAEMTIARHFAPVMAEIAGLLALVKESRSLESLELEAFEEMHTDSEGKYLDADDERQAAESADFIRRIDAAIAKAEAV